MSWTQVPRASVSISFVVSGVLVAHAQPIETITYSIEWDKAVIAPGETNKGAIYATLGPEIGTITQWNSKPGTGQSGVLKAFASTIFNFTNVENATMGSLSWKTAVEFTSASKPPTSDGNGGFSGASLGQFGPPANPSPNIKQTVKLVDVAWVAGEDPMPTDPYQVVYTTKASSAKVFLDIGLSAWVGENAVMIDAQGGFMVTPSPSVVVVGVPLLLAGLGRRRKP